MNWDDGVIVNAFNKALESFERDKKEKEEEERTPDVSKSSKEEGEEEFRVSRKELSKLLMSWYQAGYQTGRFEALCGSGNIDMKNK